MDTRNWLSEREAVLRSSAPAVVLRDFQTAASALTVYMHNLGLEDIGPMAGSLVSPNILREVESPTWGRCVLKLQGGEHPEEYLTLKAWAIAGIPCAEILDCGTAAWSPGVTHMLMRKMKGESCGRLDMQQHTIPVLQTLKKAHAAPHPSMRTLESYYTPKLKSSEQAWLTAGYNPPTEARSILGMLSSRHELIHGDPSGRNMLMNSSQLTLLDPIGVEGAAEFDAGRWIARCAAMSAPCELGELIAMAEKADPSLDRGRLLWCVGLALMSEVRYRILMPTYYQNLGASPVGFDAYTRHLSNVTSDLLN